MPADRLLHPKSSQSHKVSLLTDLEFRVWVQYLLSADDFGVMHATASRLQADNRHLQNRPVKVLLRCLEALVKSGLVRRFEHQGQSFIFSHNWQTWQKVEYPRATNEPLPPAEDLQNCDEPTQGLFEIHPGGKGKRFRVQMEVVREAPSKSLEGEPEKSAVTRAGVPANRLTASGNRLSAIGSEGGLGETVPPPIDRWLVDFTDRYPPQSRCANHLTQTAFVDLIVGDKRGPTVAYAELCERLDGHKRSHQWRVKNMIPRLDRYLREGLHLQELPEHPVAVLVNDRTAGTLAAADAAKRFNR